MQGYDVYMRFRWLGESQEHAEQRAHAVLGGEVIPGPPHIVLASPEDQEFFATVFLAHAKWQREKKRNA